jgi:glyoxylase-like metal-dependent hydrolase (beta-lactamase superfamily II)
MRKLVLFLSIFSFIGIAQVAGQTKDSLYKVTDNVYVITGYVCNISFLVTDEGVILFDSGNEPDSGKRIMSLIRTVTDKSLKYIVITHYHYDHVNGLSSLPDNIPIIAQKNELKNIKNREETAIKDMLVLAKSIDSLQHVMWHIGNNASIEFKKNDSICKTKETALANLRYIKYIYAKILVDSTYTLVLGKDTLELFYPGKCHTDGDLVTYIKSKDVMVMGDLLFTKSRPYIDPLGDIQNWAAQLIKIANRNVKYYIPGHNMVATSNEVRLMAAYLNDMYKNISDLKRQSKTLDEIKKSNLLPEYDSLNFSFFRDQNIEAIYNQIK